MELNLKASILGFMAEQGILTENVHLPDITLDPQSIRVVMINEVPPANPDDFFYSLAPDPDYMKTTRGLFQNAGVDAQSIGDILQRGIYITTAVKSPKQGYAVETEKILEHLPILEYELSLFPNAKVVMLMGDVAKKAYNMIAKKRTGKNAIPSGSTCRIRGEAFYSEGVRVFPSYIMTGGNILIEKSKCEMISDDIRRMMALL